MIKIIESAAEWRDVVALSNDSDCYHSYDYHNLSKKENETPVLVKYQEGNRVIALPLIVRNIEGTSFRDVTSVYGYSGPITYNVPEGFDNSGFQKEFIELFRDNNIVSVFSRLNPYVPHQANILSGLGNINSTGKVVLIDLNRSEEEQKASYNRRLRTYINKSRRVYDIKKADTKEEILEFISLYYQNLTRVKANENYFFEEDYFFNLMKSKDFEAEILLAKQKSDGEIMGAAMFVKTRRIVQYHLSGAKEKALKLNPIKLLIDEMRQRATQEGFSYFNLGGGVGNQEDSLFKFKSGYSKECRSFSLWKLIVDQDAYKALVTATTYKRPEKITEKCKDFFPLYRCAN